MCPPCPTSLPGTISATHLSRHASPPMPLPVAINHTCGVLLELSVARGKLGVDAARNAVLYGTGAARGQAAWRAVHYGWGHCSTPPARAAGGRALQSTRPGATVPVCRHHATRGARRHRAAAPRAAAALRRAERRRGGGGARFVAIPRVGQVSGWGDWLASWHAALDPDGRCCR